MLIKRRDIQPILYVMEELKDKKFNVELQYKFIKLKKSLTDELAIYQEQVFDNCKDFFEVDENGEYVVSPEGGYAIQKEKIKECNMMIYNLDNVDVQIPDMYLSLDELDGLGLSLASLEVLERFIKE